MVSMRRLPGPKNPAEMTYYAQLNGEPISGTIAAKTLSTLDSQTMALTLGYFVQVQAERKLINVLYQCHTEYYIIVYHMCEEPSKSGTEGTILINRENYFNSFQSSINWGLNQKQSYIIFK